MKIQRQLGFLLLIVLSFAGWPLALCGQKITPSMYQDMRWRMIGPFRASRTRAAVGVASRPNVFYIGAVNGGVWKTDDYGRTWSPIFDDQGTGSIGAIAVAPSDPNVIYVGSGEGLQRPDLSTGDGMYKSTDAGRTWTHLGLRDSQQIPQIIVDPHDPNRLFVAALGHPYGPSEERGIFRSTDGGQTFQKVLYKDANTGGSDLAYDPSNSNVVYAALWESRQGPWENAAWSGSSGGIFKSRDGGATWRQLTKGLPGGEEGVVQANLAVAPSNPNRIYAAIATRSGTGIYLSDDAGESWARITTDARPAARIGGGDLPRLAVNPKNPDIVFSDSVVAWKSVDGGKTWTAFVGAPGGMDYQNMWINPNDPDIMLITADQGAIITVNGGRTWSSWYNQPMAQMFHVSTDNQWPYWVYSGQQDSGSAGVASRSNWGSITFREFLTVGVVEHGYVAPDPLNTNIIYGGKLTKYDRITGQVQNVAPDALQSGKYRTVRTAPLLFSTVDPHILYFGTNVLFKTTNGGHSWDIISPDLTRETYDIPESVGKYRTPDMAKMARRGVIYTIAPSYKDINVIWVGTDDGLIQVTRDGGKTWANVTPPAITFWSKISIMDAGRFDVGTAYAAVNRIRCDDQRPHIYRTHDFGKTWEEIVSGLPENAPVNAVREDPIRKGLLFCGTERAIHVSFNDGGEWLPLRLNMPATSMRDLVVKDDDLVVGTHGRSFWILDDITPLRQIDERVAAAEAYLFKPQVATRVRWNVTTDSALPPEEPAGQNPPDGAIINYWLKTAPSGPVTLEVFDSGGKLFRRFSSADKIEPINEKELSIPAYWVRPPQALGAEAGMHRFILALHYPAPQGMPQSYPIAAIYKDTAPVPTGPWVLPGEYTVKMTVGGKTYTQPLRVKMDPRVRTSPADLALQFKLSMQCYEGTNQARQALAEMRTLRARIKALGDRLGKSPLTGTLAEFDKKIEAIEGAGEASIARGSVASAGTGKPTLGRAAREMGSLMVLLSGNTPFQGGDMRPTTQAVAAVEQTSKTFRELMAAWENIKTKGLAELNLELRKAGQPALTLEEIKKN
jgi:photosystem II stability/assembly factor-like uncharacterized protein